MTADWPYAPGWSLQQLCDRWDLHITGVIHAGAFTGDELDQYRAIGVDNVWWIEANPYILPRLRSRVEPYGHHVIEACLSDTDGGIAEFNITNCDGLSSSILLFGTHQAFSPHMQFVDHIVMNTRTIDSIVAEHGIKDVNFLAMDLQGAEGLCLSGARRLLSQVNAVFSEVNTDEVYLNCVRLPELDQMLGGFQRVDTWMIGNQGWGDALYVRRSQIEESAPAAVVVEPKVTVKKVRADLPIATEAVAGEKWGVRFKVFVPFYNAGSYIERCIDSIASQTCPPDEVLVLDDASTEDTAGVAKRCADEGFEYRRTMFNQKMPRNLGYLRAFEDDPQSVIVIVDGDDYLRPDALERLAKCYEDPEVWLTWGSYERDGRWAGWDPNPAMDWPDDVKRDNAYRRYRRAIPFNHPLTFRRHLYDHLADADLKDDEGQWFSAGYDYALMLPLTELAGSHGRFVSEVLYVYNEGNAISDNKVRAAECARTHEIVARRPARQPL